MLMRFGVQGLGFNSLRVFRGSDFRLEGWRACIVFFSIRSASVLASSAVCTAFPRWNLGMVYKVSG